MQRSFSQFGWYVNKLHVKSYATRTPDTVRDAQIECRNININIDLIIYSTLLKQKLILVIFTYILLYYSYKLT